LLGDAWAFERILEQAEVRWKEGQKDEAIKVTEKAIELYKDLSWVKRSKNSGHVAQ